MNKIVGLLTAWGAEQWIKPAIEQALEYCDEVVVVVSSFAPELDRFGDATLNICKTYKDIKLLDYKADKETISTAVADTLNYMLKSSSLYKLGNWVWILDVDEFYADSAYSTIRATIDSEQYDQITVESKFFYINMQHYLNETGNRLFKIDAENECFVPTNKWSATKKHVYYLVRDDGMFHYGLLASVDAYRIKWQIEYDGKRQPDKIRWLEEIYSHYDLEDEERWLGENRRRFSIYSPWLNKGFMPAPNGKLYRYAGKHPRVIEKTGLTEIKDFRRNNT